MKLVSYQMFVVLMEHVYCQLLFFHLIIQMFGCLYEVHRARGPTQGQFLEYYSLWEGPVLEKLMKDCNPWDEPVLE